MQIHLPPPKSFPIFLVLAMDTVFLRDNILDLEMEKQIRESGATERVISAR